MQWGSVLACWGGGRVTRAVVLHAMLESGAQGKEGPTRFALLSASADRHARLLPSLLPIFVEEGVRREQDK